MKHSEYIWLRLKYIFGSRKNEIENLKYLIARDDMVIEELERIYCPPDYCCPSCASAEYTFLVNKNERRKLWLRILINKKGIK